MHHLSPEVSSVLPALCYAVPRHDLEEFTALPDDARKEVMKRLSLLKEIASAKSKNGACKAIAARLQQPGYSAKRLRTLHYQFCSTGTDEYEAGDWRIVLNKSTAPEFSRREIIVPEPFKEFVHDFLCLNQRGKARQRYRALLTRLHLWRKTGSKEYSIPGYTVPPPDAVSCDHPIGWSYARLMKLKPTKFTQKAISIGRGAASAHRPKVATTRAELKVGEIFMFDDQVHDVRVNFVGNQRKIQRPLELVAMDCFSSCFVAHGFKPTTLGEDGARVMLRQEDMVWFALNWLQNVGWREDTGTLVIAEHGTAKFPDWMIEKIVDLTEGKIRFEAGGVDRRPAFMAQFEGPARGNFRIKAGLESTFNLVRNETASMTEFPGQVGRNRDNSPEEWEARTRHNELVLQAMQMLPEETRQLARFPFLEWNQFLHLALSTYNQIDRRTWHELEGWSEAGLVIQEARLSPGTPWLPMGQLLELPEFAAINALLQANPVELTRVRPLSPYEVWHNAKNELKRAPGYWTPLILPPSYGVERKVTDESLFEFVDGDISPSPLRYIARLSTGRWLRPGEAFSTFVNPWAPELLHVTDARGRYIGACRIDVRVSKNDLEAIHKKCGEMAKYEKELLLPVARAGAELARKRADDAAHNAALLKEHTGTKPVPLPPGVTGDLDVLGISEDRPETPTATSSAQEDALNALGS